MAPRDQTETPAAAGFTPEERAAMKERAKEVRVANRRGRAADKAAAAAKELEARIAEMPEPDRSLARQFHEIVRAKAPGLAPKLWYGMPAYARDGEVVCFFQGSAKFNSRYSTIGFNDSARLDDGDLWPTAFAVVTIGSAEAERIADLVERAAG